MRIWKSPMTLEQVAEMIAVLICVAIFFLMTGFGNGP